MQCYTELIPPTGVTHALSLPFTSENAKNLIVAKTSLLQIFRVSANAKQDAKLVLVTEYNLSGTITALSRVHIENSKGGGDAVLVAFRDAKLSLVEWDPAHHGISTISIHYYENHAAQAAPWTTDPQHSITHLTVDPNSRCAAFNFSVSSLAIIPFQQAGDDLAMDDVDSLNGDAEDPSPTKQTNGDSAGSDRPYHPSFVLPMIALDPSLLHPVDMAFLHEYRNPTIGVLYSTTARSNNMSAERRDVMIYSVYALEIEQRASTTLQTVHNLPNDVSKVYSLPAPVGGALLLGGNEVVHVAEGGKATAIAVNEFAREASSFPMSDAASLSMRLEGSQIVQVEGAGSDVLVILGNGDLAILSFRMEGRNVSAMTLRQIESETFQGILRGPASSTASLGADCVFVGSETSDSLVLTTGKRGPLLRRQTSRAQTQVNGHAMDIDNDDMEDDEVDDDDDIFDTDLAPAGGQAMAGDGTSVSGYNIRIMDRLPCIAPLRDIAMGRSLKRKREDEADDTRNDGVELAVAYGRGRAGGIAFLSPHLQPQISQRFPGTSAVDVWYVASTDTKIETGSPRGYAITSESREGSASSSLWTIGEDSLENKDGTEFETSTSRTIAVGSLPRSGHTIHITETDMRVYDKNFGLSQIVPIVDEDEGSTAKVIRATIAEASVMLLKDDASIALYKADSTGELEELDLPDPLSSSPMAAVSFYLDETDFFQTSRFHKSSAKSANTLCLFLTKDGVLMLLPVADPKMRIFQFDGMHFLPLLLAADMPLPKHWRNKDEISDVIVADLGDEADQRPHIIVQTTAGDVVIYEPYPLPDVTGSFRMRKIASRNAEYDEGLFDDDGEIKIRLPSLRIIEDLNGLVSVLVPGLTPRLVVKRGSTAPHIYDISSTKSLSVVRNADPQSKLLLIDGRGELCFGNFPSSAVLGISDWVIDRIDLDEDVSSLTYFPSTQSYILATNYDTKFQLPQDDEWHSDWQNERTTFLPTTTQSTLKLMSSRTHRMLSQHHFDPNERVLCTSTMNLEVSEKTHERQDLIVVGTAITKGENVVTRGNIYLFSVVDVVPYPSDPESNLKLKLLTREDVRGAVTSLTSIGSQGFLLAAQGQKAMVRGLREDMSILPVAFMDMRYYVSVSRSLPSTGLTILGDAFSGLWLVGYSEEPYKLQLLGRDLDNPSVAAADFLPSGKELYIISSDLNGQLRILQYDPENPKSERGSKLLLRSTFDTGSTPTKMLLLPRTPTAYERATTTTTSSPSPDDPSPSPSTPQTQLLLLSQTGSLSLLTPLSDATYRRLSALQNILSNTSSHPCSLNPRAYRAVETDGMGGRGVIDGELIKRWHELSSAQKANLADKVGSKGVWEVRGDLEGVCGGWGVLG